MTHRQANRILLAGNDVGGVLVLQAMVTPLMEAGWQVTRWAHGYGTQVWPDADSLTQQPDTASLESAFDTIAPDLLVTGTSRFDTFEHDLWNLAKKRGIPSVAVLDASYNLKMRFERGQELNAQPDILALVDEQSRADIQTESWCSARLEVVGQPHLENVAETLHVRRAGRTAGSPPMLLFASEAFREVINPHRPIGFDQFSVAESVLTGLRSLNRPQRLVIKRHPIEPSDTWAAWIKEHAANGPVEVELSEADTNDLLAVADGVIGMSSGLLLEAAAAGIPLLALQPERNYILNPAAEILKPLTNAAALPAAIAGFPGSNKTRNVELQVAGSQQRLLVLLTHALSL
ncbi:hypothetical protein L2D14_08060 [Thalassospiraceae bacterium LMO-JJ14]|nr:hypothetical protein L2D14_08060 [Thalassospiraceae bacterium LMO-JJ14]